MIKLSPRNSSYAWRWNMPVKAEIVGAELEKIQEEHGELTPVIVVDAARSSDNPMHRLFTWDDAVAGERYRHTEAQFILRNLRINYIRKEDEDDEEPRVLRVRAFVNVEMQDDTEGEEAEEPTEARRVYLSTSVAFQNPQHRRYVLDQAKTELETWRNRYAAFKEFDGIVREIDKALKTLTTEVKAAA